MAYTERVTHPFWSKVIKTPGCWLWAGGITNNGYGNYRDPSLKNHLCHRYSYKALVGVIPKDLVIDHLCANRSCVNPDHLEAVTCRENLLRGNTFNAVNVAKVECPQGHPYSGDNLLISNGRRTCRVCNRAKAMRHYHKKKVLHDL